MSEDGASGVDVLCISRGRGRGHAIPDAAILQEVSALRPDLRWRIASYASGAKALRDIGVQVDDLALPEENPLFETMAKLYDLLNRCRPRVIVAHEEFAAVVVAELLKIPAVFMTDWFVNETSIIMQALAYARCVLFLEEQGTFDEPSFLQGKVRYVGPMVRKMSYTRQDRVRARQRLGIDEQSCAMCFLPGGWATEARAPALDLVLGAFDEIRAPDKKLFWVAGSDASEYQNRMRRRTDVNVVRQFWPIEELIVACDLVLTKGNRGTIIEAACLGIPSLLLSHGLNPVEDSCVLKIRSNRALRVKGLSSEYLARCMELQIAVAGQSGVEAPRVIPAREVARELVELMRL